MTYAGARGETQRQMADTLRHRLPQSSLHPAFERPGPDPGLERQAPGRTPNSAGEASQYFRLNIANAIWGQGRISFPARLSRRPGRKLRGRMMAADFAGAPDESRVRINDWVAEETEGKVTDLLPPGAVDQSTRLVLTNAIYFNASWLWPFSPSRTEVRPFYLAGAERWMFR